MQAGTVECGHTAAYYYIGKDPAFAFFTAMPFGLNTRQMTAWLRHGGGNELAAELFRDYNIHRHPRRRHRRPDGRLVPQRGPHARRTCTG